MEQGIIKKFDVKKGFGFIRPEAGGADVFVHFSKIVGDGFRTLDVGDVVTYTSVKGQRGMQAEDVRVVEKASKG